MADRPTPEDPIRPAPVTLAGTQPEAPKVQGQGPSGPSAPVLAGLALVLGAGGFFLLGQLSPTPEAPRPAQAQEGPAARAAGADAEGPAPSPAPFADAATQAAREAAQGTLRRFLARRTELEDHGAALWAESDLAAITRQAEAGDAAFLAGQLDAALSAYEAALQGAEALWATLPARQAAQAAEAAARLEANDVTTAETAYALLRAMAGDNTGLREDAERGLRRAERRPAVLDALARAEIALTNEDWAAADGHLKEARGLDGDAPGVATLSETLDRERRRQALEAALGEGYDALAREDYTGAQSAFNKALSLNGGAAAAEEGLALVATQRLEARLAALQDQAEAARSAEAFSEALAHYEAALALDGNLAFAQEGRQAMTDRLALAGALTEAERTLGKDPSDAVLRHARETLALAEPFLSAEPRLAQQVEALRTRLAAAETPRTVRLESDGKTTVQVLKVRHLGALTEQALPLRPGNYIALGSRDGYRDVRVSFTVPLEAAPPAIAVVCRDRI
jgi:tetratricopeptide (TPR) repeat protein